MDEQREIISQALKNLNKLREFEKQSGYGYLNVKPLIRDLENFNQQCYQLIPEESEIDTANSHSCPSCGYQLSVAIG